MQTLRFYYLFIYLLDEITKPLFIKSCQQSSKAKPQKKRGLEVWGGKQTKEKLSAPNIS